MSHEQRNSVKAGHMDDDTKDASAGLTEEEAAWVDFLRLIGGGEVPRLTLKRIQLMRRVCRRCRW